MDLAEVYLLTPLPGTPIWKYASKHGLVTTSGFDWSRIDLNAYRRPNGWIHLANKIPRELLWSWYQAIRRQCLRHNLRVIWKHPFRGDFLKVVKGLGKQMLVDSWLGNDDQHRGKSLGGGIFLRGLSWGVSWFVAKVNSWLRFFK